jgi:chromosomal replication initiator protein
MQDLWQLTRTHIRSQVDDKAWQQYFRHLVLSKVDGAQAIFGLPDAFYVTWFQNNFADYLEEVIAEVTGQPLTVAFVTKKQKRSTSDKKSLDAADSRQGELRLTDGESTDEHDEDSTEGEARSERITAPSESIDELATRVGLNPRYTFDNFVVGSSNQFSHAASQAVADRPATAYNPLFLYGGVGLGKTHLLHAIGLEILRQRPGLRVMYITSESFMNALIHSLRTRDTNSFRSKFRDECDVLLMDDVQFIAGKESTQEEFFHTFNALHQAYKQIVITSDKPPHELAGLEERLMSRFGWGLIADIKPPGIETRIAIITKKADEEKFELGSDVALFLATQFHSNVRELEGSLVRLKAYASLFSRPITLEIAKEQLKGLIVDRQRRVTLEGIQKLVARHFDVDLNDLVGPRRFHALSHPRHVAMYLTRQHTELSYPEIARRFGGRDHSTIINAVRKIETQLASDDNLNREIRVLEQLLLH